MGVLENEGRHVRGADAKAGAVVFDKAYSMSRDPLNVAGATRTNNVFAGFHRDAKDRAPARGNSTAKLMGDPPPGVVARHRPLWQPRERTNEL